MGSFSDRRWAEWNGKYRDAIRRWVKGDPIAGELATRVAGSYDLFDKPEDVRSPFESINFVACHDGFTMNDLVSYDEKHNERNGEGGRDGTNDNHSWNCGCEGPVDRSQFTEAKRREIETLRNRQVKNFMTLLFLSQGTPMLLYGDEIRRTSWGNNNTVFQDNEFNYVNWADVNRHAEILRFTKEIISFRKRHQIVRQRRYLKTVENEETVSLRNITWHGVKPSEPDFDGGSRFLAWILEPFKAGDRNDQPIYVGSNVFWESIEVELPPLAEGNWRRIIDTSLQDGHDIVAEDKAVVYDEPTYLVAPRSTIVLLGGGQEAR